MKATRHILLVIGLFFIISGCLGAAYAGEDLERKSAESTDFMSLSPEIRVYIFSFLPPQEYSKVNLLSKNFGKVPQYFHPYGIKIEKKINQRIKRKFLFLFDWYKSEKAGKILHLNSPSFFIGQIAKLSLKDIDEA